MEVVPFRAEVVVDDVEDEREPVRMAGVEEALQPFGTAVRGVRRV